MSKYYLIKIEGELVNVANKQLLCNYEDGVELTEEELKEIKELTRDYYKQMSGTALEETYDKIRKVLDNE